MPQTVRDKHQQYSNKLLSFLFNFFASKLIIFTLLPVLLSFISINGDNNVDTVTATSATAGEGFIHLQRAIRKANETTDNERIPFILESVARESQITEDKGHKCKDDNSARRQYDEALNVTSAATDSTMESERCTETSNGDYRADNIEKEGNFNESGERILSRRRRYLTFLPGSSLQIIYDTYHPILGYSSYLTLAITAAMAWELPQKPFAVDDIFKMRPSTDDRNDQITITKNNDVQNANDTNRRTSSNIYYTNVPPPRTTSNKQQRINPFYRYPSYVSNNNQFGSSNKMHYYLSYADKLMSHFQQLSQNLPKKQTFSPSRLNNMVNTIRNSVPYTAIPNNYRRHHFVHPVFKKRRASERLSALEKFDLNLHRSSRHKLYRQMDTFLKTQGSDGMECILKMLCETGQREDSTKPGSMVLELLRAIFTLPGPVEPVEQPLHHQYDQAYASKQDCKKTFPNCIESVYNPKFFY